MCMCKEFASEKTTYEICSSMSLEIKLHVQQMPLTVEMAKICTYKLKFSNKSGCNKRDGKRKEKKIENSSAYERWSQQNSRW